MTSVSPSVSSTDADLARRLMAAPAGRAEADERELVRRFGPRVRAYGLRHLSDPSLADDLVQSVLELTIVKLRGGEVREPERIASFVLGVARMQAHAMRRRASRESPTEVESTDRLIADPGPEPRPLARELLANCLEELTERERSVLLLSFFDEENASEIAATLATSPGNVRVIRHRAVDRLRKCMGLAKERP